MESTTESIRGIIMAALKNVGLFNFKTPVQRQQEYLAGLMVSPSQMGQQSLLQQIASIGTNAGALIGYGAGRMFGGKLPGEAEQETLQAINADVQKLDLPEPEKYREMAKRASAAGFDDIAVKLSDKAGEIELANLKKTELQEGIIDKRLSNYFNKATLLPRVQEKFVALQQAEEAVKTAKQAYAQADKMNPLALKQAAATLANTEQTYQRVAEEMEQFKKLSPTVVAQAEINLQTSQQGYKQNEVMNPLAAAKEKLSIALSQQTYAQNAKMNPALLAKAQADVEAAQLNVNKEIKKQALQDILSISPAGSDEHNFALRQLAAIESPASLMPTKPGEEAERIAAADFGKPYAQLDKEQKLKVNNKIDAQKIAQSAATGTGNAKVPDANASLERIRIETQGSRDLLDSADEGLRNLSLGTGVADQLVNRALATMSGDKSLSMAEVQSIANRNGFVGSVANAVEGFTTGRMSEMSRRDKRILLEAYREAAVNRVNKQLDYLKGVYQSTSFSKEQVEQLIEPRRPKSTIQFKVETYSKFPYEPNKYDYKFEGDKVFRAPK